MSVCRYTRMQELLKHFHIREIARLKSQLELEREKREELERETDELRKRLHQANVELLRHQLTSQVSNQS